MSPMSVNPLSDEELDELDRILLETEGLEHAMDISMLDGFFAALMSGPNTILPSDWMPWVWDAEKGVGSPVFGSRKDAQRVMELMMRHMNDVTVTLLQRPQEYEPLLMESPGDPPIPVIDGWCTGFMKGVALDAEGWLPVTAGHPDWMSTIATYGTQAGWDILDQNEPTLDAQRASAAGLGDAVRRVHAFFLEGRNARAAAGESGFRRREPVRNSSKTGRNDPCPCGSGRKYKHCHGSGQGTMH